MSAAADPVPIREAIVPVAGLGTRLLPATRSAPKEMLPIVDTPVVQHVVEELAAAGIERVLMVTGRRKRAIEDHFDADPELGSGPLCPRMSIAYVRQPRPAGLGDAVRRGAGFVMPASPGVVVALGDAVLEAPEDGGPTIVTRLTAAHARWGADATLAVTEVPPESVSHYGIVSGAPVTGADGDDGGVLGVSGMVEKPMPGTVESHWAVAGRYVLGSAVLEALGSVVPDARGEIGLTEAIAAVIAQGGRVLAVPLRAGEHRHDIGSVGGYCATFLRYALRHPEHGAALRAQAAALLADE